MAKGIYIGELSERYTEVEYLQSSGTQYIDTGYKPGGNTRVVCEFARIANSPTANYGAALFGARNSKNSYDYTFWGFNHLDDKLTDNYYSTDKHITFPGTERVVVDKNKNVTTVNNNSSYSVTHTYTNFTSSYNLYVFATNKAGSPDTMQMGTIRVYYLKIYDNGVLVRDFVPAVNLKKEYGFYDKVNSQFYTNSGTGAFTIGQSTGNILSETVGAQKVRKIYVGINNLAKKITKAYIGIGGVARPCFGVSQINYYGSITKLSNYHQYSKAAASNKNYAIYIGNATTADAYNKNLTLTTVNYGNITANSAAAFNKKYVISSGGYWSSTYFKTVVAYNNQLIKSNATDLTLARASLSAANTGEYVIFGGGGNGTGQKTTEAYNWTLTRTIPETLSLPASEPSAENVGKYALFVGGYTASSGCIAECYDDKLIKILIEPLADIRGYMASASSGDYAMFAGGWYTTNSPYTSVLKSTVDVYNKSLTRMSVPNLSQEKRESTATSLKDYFIVAGGCDTGYKVKSNIDIYDPHFVKTISSTKFTTYAGQAASIEDYAIFAGGGYGSGFETRAVAFVAQ